MKAARLAAWAPFSPWALLRPNSMMAPLPPVAWTMRLALVAISVWKLSVLRMKASTSWQSMRLDSTLTSGSPGKAGVPSAKA